MIWRYIFLVSLYVMAMQSALGQTEETSREVSEEMFQTLQKEISYDKKKRIVASREFNRKNREKKSSTSGMRTIGGLAGLIKLLGYVAIVILVGVIAYFVFSGIKRETKISPVETDLQAFEELEEIDADDGLKDALAAGDFRTAIRMQFILVLQYLSDVKAIDWKPDKTNRDYQRELHGSLHYLHFRELSHIYEWVWYGNTVIDAQSYATFGPKFSNFLQR